MLTYSDISAGALVKCLMQMARSLKFMLSNNEDTAIEYTEKVLGQQLSGVMVYHQLMYLIAYISMS